MQVEPPRLLRVIRTRLPLEDTALEEGLSPGGQRVSKRLRQRQQETLPEHHQADAYRDKGSWQEEKRHCGDDVH